MLQAIDRAIPFPLLFQLTHSDQVRFAASYKRPNEADSSKWVIEASFETESQPLNAERRPLPVALDLARLYQQIVRRHIPLPPRDGESLMEHIVRYQSIKTKKRERKQLEARRDREKQFNRKVELNAQVRALRAELSLTATFVKHCSSHMEKLKLHTPDQTASNIEKIGALFPDCVVETRDEKGQLRREIDFDQLRQELSDHIVEGPPERYHLDWPGKREALLAANAPIAKTLRPCRQESVDFDTTKNLFVEGDNLDALKLLQETYLGKVKFIYIDPPYNTGNDLIYDDDFAEDFETYLVRSNQRDEAGSRLVANIESNGRFHSDWLTMMYSRLRLASNLLDDDGVLFASL